MIVQACLNGARDSLYHPSLPLTAANLARDAIASVAAGAAELHMHPRAAHGAETLEPSVVDAAVRAVRNACPGSLIGVSTGAWIERGELQTRAHIEGWTELPDYASVNLSENDSPAVMKLLNRRGIGVEAGLASVADAKRLIGLESEVKIFRILVEIGEQMLSEASKVAEEIFDSLQRAGLRKPVLLHGFDETVWPFVALAAERRCSTRVGLEDGRNLPDGSITPDNAALVRAAVEMFRSRE